MNSIDNQNNNISEEKKCCKNEMFEKLLTDMNKLKEKINELKNENEKFKNEIIELDSAIEQCMIRIFLYSNLREWKCPF
jgi:uncharacterized coiled-coil DUF342 family protein